MKEYYYCSECLCYYNVNCEMLKVLSDGEIDRIKKQAEKCPVCGLPLIPVKLH